MSIQIDTDNAAAREAVIKEMGDTPATRLVVESVSAMMAAAWPVITAAGTTDESANMVRDCMPLILASMASSFCTRFFDADEANGMAQALVSATLVMLEKSGGHTVQHLRIL